ncbi:TRAP transporter substrate-binding protein [Azohydromonas caseinilytica]|uniref:TRAP transporter substrate-binding protein n=1 Tax=Azohydromonas caseinilytica TaxID=2728836 RepID=A0A848F9M8_9BURK|nr:TRAP transporter substrate-binding protein [Azohydromonas caseinilytica]NML15958.1 TRAP transporter substrate-binding protein [Azohydromonas caseinilytica]
MLKPLLAALALSSAAFVPAQAAPQSPSASAPAKAQAETIRWQVATPFPETSLHTENLMQFAQEVERASQGRIKIVVKPDAALKAAEAKRAVQNGQVQMAEIQLADVQSEWQTFGLDSIPFLASGYAQARKLYQAQRVPLGKRFAGQSMVMLYSVPSAPPGLFLRKPVKQLGDLRQLKWAAYSPATERMAKLLGAKAVAMPEAHVAQAVTQGEVDAALVSADGFNADAFESMEVFLDLQAWLPRHGVLMNLQAFEQLDMPLRKAVIKAAVAAEQRGWQQSEARHRRFLGGLRDMGMDVVEPPEPLRTGLLKTVGEPLLDEWLQRTGPEGKLIIDDYRR